MHYFATTFIARSFAAFFRIGFHVERNFLSFFKRLVTIALNCAEMYENVIAAFIVCDEAEAFRRVKPFYSSDAQCYYFLF